MFSSLINGAIIILMFAVLGALVFYVEYTYFAKHEAKARKILADSQNESPPRA